MEYNILFFKAALLMNDMLSWQTKPEFYNIILINIIPLMAFCLFKHKAPTYQDNFES